MRQRDGCPLVEVHPRSVRAAMHDLTHHRAENMLRIALLVGMYSESRNPAHQQSPQARGAAFRIM
jgi:hypothetical protein